MFVEYQSDKRLKLQKLTEKTLLKILYASFRKYLFYVELFFSNLGMEKIIVDRSELKI